MGRIYQSSNLVFISFHFWYYLHVCVVKCMCNNSTQHKDQIFCVQYTNISDKDLLIWIKILVLLKRTTLHVHVNHCLTGKCLFKLLHITCSWSLYHCCIMVCMLIMVLYVYIWKCVYSGMKWLDWEEILKKYYCIKENILYSPILPP